MKNIYDGIAILDSNGAAIVNVPTWVEVLNKDFRYQLTPIGGSAPNLFIADEISNGCFRIAGGVQGAKVSWQITGIRKDPWAQSNPINTEEEKVDGEKGYYLHPELYNLSEDNAIMWSRYPNVMRAAKERRR